MPKEIPKMSQIDIESSCLRHTVYRDEEFINSHVWINQLIWAGGEHDPWILCAQLEAYEVRI